MKDVRKIIRKQLFELYENDSFGTAIKSGEYSTEEMENFLFKIVDLVQWGDKNYGDGPHITIPGSWPASSVSYTPESIIGDWEKAKQYYSDPDTKWYVWTAKVGGNLNKPQHVASQRIDLDSILRIVSKYPESFNYITIGVGNEMTKKYGDSLNTQGD